MIIVVIIVSTVRYKRRQSKLFIAILDVVHLPDQEHAHKLKLERAMVCSF